MFTLHERVGFSTGSMFVVYPDSQGDRIQTIAKWKPECLEVMLWNEVSAWQLLEPGDKAMEQMLGDYRLSIHVPTAEKYLYFDGSLESGRMMSALNEIKNLYQPKYFVFHPDRIKSFSNLTKSELPIALENSDALNTKWQRPESLGEYTNDGLRVVVDIAHVLSLGLDDAGTMALLAGFLGSFNGSIAGFHISDCYPENGHHRLLSTSDRKDVGQKMIAEIAREHTAPLIIESPFSKECFSQEIIKELALFPL